MNVDLKKITQTSGVQADIGKTQKVNTPSSGPSFADTLTGLTGGGLESKAPAGLVGNAAVKFSNHAIERMTSRGIKFSPDDVSRLNDAVARAGAKGSKDTLVLMNDAALIVSVKNKTVVTVMDKSALKENVFTNIDSTIVM
ncbi:MAG: TIGR02530 family flagellar biosynthesis protein [Bdellovibrio sp.]|jgi:flagellar operon protein